MNKYSVEYLMSVTRKYADPSRGEFKAADNVAYDDIEAESEELALEAGLDRAIKELATITGVVPKIDDVNLTLQVIYPNGASVTCTDFHIKKD